MFDISNKVILVTGGTGSFGKKFTEIIFKRYKPKKLIIFSRGEVKQHEMQKIFTGEKYKNIRYFIGDVRDPNRLHRAFNGVDIVIHAAALKIVPTSEYNPFEAIKTNIIGAENVINAAIDNNVKKVLAISTDKAANPTNLYGATKLCAEKMFIQGNSYSSTNGTRLSCVRYGNVIGSRGSVVSIFEEQKKKSVLTITDRRMTRFWITLEEGVNFVIKCIELMQGGEVFVPKIPSMGILELANLIGPKCRIEEIGIKPGEKINEVLITEDETRHTKEFEDYYIIEPEFPWWGKNNHKGGKKLSDGFRYTSNNNSRWLAKEEMKRILQAA